MSSKEIHSYCVYVEKVTERAVLCQIGEHSFWLPLSQIEYSGELEEQTEMTIDVPEWLAIEKGLE